MPRSIIRWAFLAVFVLCRCTAAEDGGDPYLWLEEVDGARALAWVEAQNHRTAEILERRPEYAGLYRDALAALDVASRIPDVEQRGAWLYDLWRDADHPRGLYRRTTVEELRQEAPAWETVLDVDELARREERPWVFKGMECLPPQHRRCLVFLSAGGGDAVVMRELDAVEKRFVRGGFELPEAKMDVAWRDADTLFVATDFGAGTLTESGYPRQVKLWHRGTPLEAATTLVSAPATAVAASARRLRSQGPDVDLVSEERTFWTSRTSLLRDDGPHPLDLPESAVVEDAFRGRLVITLHADWQRGDATLPEGAVLVADPAALTGGEGAVEVLVRPSATAVVEAVEATPQGVLVTMLDNVEGRIDRYEPTADGGWTRHPIPLPEHGSLAVTTSDDQTGTFFVRYESFTTPPTLYRVAGPAWRPEVIRAQAATFDGDRFRVEQHFATSADGTRVPYFVVLAKEAVLDGENPTHLFSYGGFRIPLTPTYSGVFEDLSGAYGKLWLERGGVFVLANIRGGGELGPAWHRAALLANRPRAYEDFEAVARDLVRRRITSPEHLGIEGRSNGGLLVGAALTRHPELYGAVVCGSPLLDMKRYHRLLAGASWMAEYGDPDDPAAWRYISSYSPYQNVAAGRSYPPVFFYTSTRDDRVHPGHARKMAAKMLDLGYDVRYFENTEGGHAGSSTHQQLAHRLALAYTHLWSLLGRRPERPAAEQ